MKKNWEYVLESDRKKTNAMNVWLEKSIITDIIPPYTTATIASCTQKRKKPM